MTDEEIAARLEALRGLWRKALGTTPPWGSLLVLGPGRYAADGGLWLVRRVDSWWHGQPLPDPCHPTAEDAARSALCDGAAVLEQIKAQPLAWALAGSKPEQRAAFEALLSELGAFWADLGGNP